MTKLLGYGALVMVMSSSFAMASGFRCEGEGYKVKLYNKTTATRTPAKLVVSTSRRGTLLSAGEDEITKKNRANSVQYIVDGNTKIEADRVILQINYKEGRDALEEGDEVDGQLILINDADEERDVYELVCTRYLKN